MSEEARRQTANTYDHSAKEFVDHFKDVGPRTDDVDRIFKLLKYPQNANVLEIGCGDGRDAREILKHGAHYTGIDISESFIEIARKTAPQGTFEVADAAKFDFPSNLDAVIAFASLLHLSKEENSELFKKAHAALKPGGILYVSLKYRPTYSQELQVDKFGTRLFYFYSEEDVLGMAGSNFTAEVNYRKTLGDTEWLEMALRNNP